MDVNPFATIGAYFRILNTKYMPTPDACVKRDRINSKPSSAAPQYILAVDITSGSKIKRWLAVVGGGGGWSWRLERTLSV